VLTSRSVGVVVIALQAATCNKDEDVKSQLNAEFLHEMRMDDTEPVWNVTHDSLLDPVHSDDPQLMRALPDTDVENPVQSLKNVPGLPFQTQRRNYRALWRPMQIQARPRVRSSN
jgi:hypothetical protein